MCIGDKNSRAFKDQASTTNTGIGDQVFTDFYTRHKLSSAVECTSIARSDQKSSSGLKKQCARCSKELRGKARRFRGPCSSEHEQRARLPRSDRGGVAILLHPVSNRLHWLMLRNYRWFVLQMIPSEFNNLDMGVSEEMLALFVHSAFKNSSVWVNRVHSRPVWDWR